MVLIIIVEGPDGAGKTTLINQLMAEFNLDVQPRVVGKDTKDLVDLKQWVEDDLEKGFRYTIFDRYRLISEFIYGPTLRVEQKPGFVDVVWSIIQIQKLQQIGPIIIYCLPPLEVVRANVTGDADNTEVAEFIEPLYAGYVHRIAMDTAAGLNPIIYDYTTDGKEDDPMGVFRSAMKYAKERANQ